MPYEILEEKPQAESSLGYLGRTGARTLARGAESVLGLPGDIAGGLLGLSNYAIDKVTGHKPLPSRLPIPTSEDIRNNVTKPLTGNYLEPQGSTEGFWDDIVGDAATLLVPVKGKVPFKKALVGALGRSAAGNTAKWAAEGVTGSPLVGAVAKIGSMALAGTSGGRKHLEGLKKSSYDNAFKNVPEKTKIDVRPQKFQIDKLKNKISTSDIPDKKFLLERIESFDKLVSKNIPSEVKSSGLLDQFGKPITQTTSAREGGKALLQEIINLKQGWNQHLGDANLSKQSKNYLKKMVGIANESVNNYGSKNPKFYKDYKIGEELTNALQGTNYVQKFLSKSPLLQSTVKNPIVKHLLGVGAVTAITTKPLQSASLGAGVLGVYESAKAYQLLSRSPEARKYYKALIQDSLKNDSKAAAKNLEKLDKAADAFEKTGRFEILD